MSKEAVEIAAIDAVRVATEMANPMIKQIDATMFYSREGALTWHHEGPRRLS